MMPTQSTTKRTSEMGNRQHRHQRHRRRALETSMTTLLTPMTNATIEKLAGDRDVRPPCSTAQTHRQRCRRHTSFESSANPPSREGPSAQHRHRRDHTTVPPRRPRCRAPPRMNHTSGLEHAVSLAIGATVQRERPTLHRRGVATRRLAPLVGDSLDLSCDYLVDPSLTNTVVDLPPTVAEMSPLHGRCLGGDRRPS
jgi:hypothetical protein